MNTNSITVSNLTKKFSFSAKNQSVGLAVRGGRDGGFRTYSVRHNIRAGKWRVQVKTESGQEIGQIRFEVMAVEQAPELKSKLK
ncbi:MAG: DUF2914 domain-containing protein [Candidatus Paceibacterota bacterium]